MRDENLLSEVAKKVKKLLSLGESNNEHEASLAMLKAQELLDKYNMSLSDVEIQLEEYIFEKVEFEHKKAPKWIHRLSSIIAQNSYCKLLIGSGSNYIKFFGARPDTEVANYMVNYLHRTINELSRKYAGTHYGRVSLGQLNSIKNQYIDGVLQTIGRRLHEMREQNKATVKTASGTDLFAIKGSEVNNRFNDIYKTNKTIGIGSNYSSYDMGAYSRGKRDGNNIPLHAGVSSNGGSGGIGRQASIDYTKK